MITRQQIADGIYNNVIRFVVDPNMEHGTVCQIGDMWFYFGGAVAAEEDPLEYMSSTSIWDVISNIYEILEEFRITEDFRDEYKYYESVIMSHAA